MNAANNALASKFMPKGTKKIKTEQFTGDAAF